MGVLSYVTYFSSPHTRRHFPSQAPRGAAKVLELWGEKDKRGFHLWMSVCSFGNRKSFQTGYKICPPAEQNIQEWIALSKKNCKLISNY